MVATVPGAPKTSRTTRLGLKGLVSLALLSGVDTTSLEPKMPLSRYPEKPAIATITTATSTIHRLLSKLPGETRCIRDPFDNRRHARTDLDIHEPMALYQLG